MKKIYLIFLTICLSSIVYSQGFEDISAKQEFSPLKYSRYNRSEGLFLGGDFKISPFENRSYKAVTRFGYGLSNKKLRYALGFQRESTMENKNSFMLLLFDETRNNDEWIIGTFENTMADLLLAEDFMDYFNVKGGEFQFKYNLKKNIFIGGHFGSYSYKSMIKNTNWSIFGGDKILRNNPAVSENKELYFKLCFSFDNSEFEFFPTNSTFFDLYFEKGSDDFDYTGIGFSFRKFQNITFSQRLIAKFVVKGRKNAFSEQHLFDLGGIGSLRGYGFKEFTGNYFALLNIDYSFGGDILQKIPLQFIPIYESAALLLFFDSGMTYMAGNNEPILDSFKELNPKYYKTNIGISISLAKELIRFDFAKRLDRGSDNFVFTGRFLQVF